MNWRRSSLIEINIRKNIHSVQTRIGTVFLAFKAELRYWIEIPSLFPFECFYRKAKICYDGVVIQLKTISCFLALKWHFFCFLINRNKFLSCNDQYNSNLKAYLKIWKNPCHLCAQNNIVRISDDINRKDFDPLNWF